MKTFNKKILTTALALGMACGVSGADNPEQERQNRAYMGACIMVYAVGNVVRRCLPDAGLALMGSSAVGSVAILVRSNFSRFWPNQVPAEPEIVLERSGPFACDRPSG